MHPPSEAPASQKRRPLWKRLWFWLALPCVLVPVAIAILMLWPGWEFKTGDGKSSFGLRRSNGPDGSCRIFIFKAGPFCVFQFDIPHLVIPGKAGWRWEDGMAGWSGGSRVVAAGWPENIQGSWDMLDFFERSVLSQPPFTSLP